MGVIENFYRRGTLRAGSGEGVASRSDQRRALCTHAHAEEIGREHY
jgi:hypothetical protein